MAPGIVFRCTTCDKIITTTRGIKDHHKRRHQNYDVTRDDYVLVFLDPSQDPRTNDIATDINKNNNTTVSKVSSDVMAMQTKFSSGTTKFKTPLIQAVTTIPNKTPDNISLSPGPSNENCRVVSVGHSPRI